MVFVGERLTVKVAPVSLKKAIGEIKDLVVSFDPHHVQRTVHRLRMTSEMGPLRGIWANLHEWQVSSKLQGMVAPTHFSFFGLLNVMDTVGKLKLPPQKYADKYPGKGAGDRHTFKNPQNYGWYRGGLVLSDYGSQRAIDYLMANGEKFRRELERFGKWAEKKEIELLKRKEKKSAIIPE